MTLFNHTPITYPHITRGFGGELNLEPKDAERLVKGLGDYIGLVRGRVIRVSGLRKGKLDLRRFEQEHGVRAVKATIAALKALKPTV